MISILLAHVIVVVDPAVDAGQFARLIQGLHAQIRDVTFAYEGGVERLSESGSFVAGIEYQGRYNYRSDGAAFLDYYERGPRPDDRQVHSLFQNFGTFEALEAIPDRKLLNASVGNSAGRGGSKSGQSIGANPGKLNRRGSPERMLFLWYFQGLNNPLDTHYEFQGWEDVQGHRCLRVELDEARGDKTRGKSRFRFWIDLERGGHPLSVDWIRELSPGNAGVAFRCRDIQLAQFQDGSDAHFWLPVSCRAESFLGFERKDGRGRFVIMDRPDIVETYHVITGSVVLNHALKDSDFALLANARKHTELKNVRLDVKRSPPFRSDPKAVQKRLDEALADAEGRAAALEASASERVSWDWSRVFSIGLPSAGLILLAVAGFWKLRSNAR
jgi:hypothetical protein